MATESPLVGAIREGSIAALFDVVERVDDLDAGDAVTSV
jgi:hypothetical protein